jgi:hypothetical protein
MWIRDQWGKLHNAEHFKHIYVVTRKLTEEGPDGDIEKPAPPEEKAHWVELRDHLSWQPLERNEDAIFISRASTRPEAEAVVRKIADAMAAGHALVDLWEPPGQ